MGYQHVGFYKRKNEMNIHGAPDTAPSSETWIFFVSPVGALEMQETFGEFAAEGNAVLISTHLLDMASQLASRTVIMMKGRAIAEGNPRE